MGEIIGIGIFTGGRPPKKQQVVKPKDESIKTEDNGKSSLSDTGGSHNKR